MSRTASIDRATRETQVRLRLDLDGAGRARVATPLPFLDHMLDTVARHALFDLEVEARGDVEVDAHHTVEDIGLCLGQALLAAVGDKHGIGRFGEATLPMDETLVQVALDLSGRPAFVWRVPGLDGKWVGGFDCGLAKELFAAFANEARANVHVRLIHGENPHHVIEAAFKAFARAARQAVTLDARAPGEPPSTKGAL